MKRRVGMEERVIVAAEGSGQAPSADDALEGSAELGQVQVVSTRAKRPFTEPKLAFIKPKLVKAGKIGEHTAGTPFFGTFSP